MNYVAAKCSQCGADIQIDADRKTGLCPNCGSKFITKDIVVNNITNIDSLHVDNANVNVEDDNKKGAINKFNYYLNNKDWNQCDNISCDLIKNYEHDPNIIEIRIISLTHNYHVIENIDAYNDVKNLLDEYIASCKNNQKTVLMSKRVNALLDFSKENVIKIQNARIAFENKYDILRVICHIMSYVFFVCFCVGCAISGSFLQAIMIIGGIVLMIATIICAIKLDDIDYNLLWEKNKKRPKSEEIEDIDEYIKMAEQTND